MRELIESDVVFTLDVEQDECCDVRGNAMVSGDDDADKAVEDAILARLDDGDVWAWASVCVKATWGGFTGTDYLGGCSYKDEADFTAPGGYYEDMKAAALDDLNAKVKASHKAMLALS